MRPISAPCIFRGQPLTLCDFMRKGFIAQIPLLVRMGADCECRDSAGRTPLMLTAYVQPEDWGVGVARLLIEAGVNMAQRDNQGLNALQHACVYERVELVKVLLHALDFNLAHADKRGNTALHLAARSGNVTLVQLLVTSLRRYRLPLHVPNKRRRSPREEAIRAGHHACAALLTESYNPSANYGYNNDPSDVQVPTPRLTNTPVDTTGEDKGGLSAHSRGGRGSGKQLSDTCVTSQHQSPSGSGPPSHRSSASNVKRPSSPFNPHNKENCPAKSAPNRKSSYTNSPSSLTPRGFQHTPSLLTMRNNNNNDININGNGYIDAEGINEKEMIQVEELRDSPSWSRDQKAWKSHGLGVGSTNSCLTDQQPGRPFTSGGPAVKPLLGPRLHRDLTSLRGSTTQLPPYTKNPRQVIHVASENDIRNSREYVLKLAHIQCGPSHMGGLPEHSSPPSATAHNKSRRDNTKSKMAVNWRNSFRCLYEHYEYQCAPSWRYTARPPPPPPHTCLLSPNAGEDSDEIKDRSKSRRASTVRPGSQTGDLSAALTNAKLRKVAATRQRKGSIFGNGSAPLLSSPKPTVDRGKNASPEDSNTFLTRPNNKLDGRTSAGNGKTEAVQDLRRLSYSVPAVTETLVTDPHPKGQAMNAEPAEKDCTKLGVFDED